MLARRLANSLAQSQHRGGEAGCCCLRFDPCSLTFERNYCNQDGFFRRRGHFQQTSGSGLPQSRQIHFQTIRDTATCVYMHIYIYKLYIWWRKWGAPFCRVSGSWWRKFSPRSKRHFQDPCCLAGWNLVPRICTPRFISLSIIPGYCRVSKVNQLCSCGDCWCIIGLSLWHNVATMVTVMRSKSWGCHRETWQDRFCSNRTERLDPIIDPERIWSMNRRRYYVCIACEYCICYCIVAITLP